MYFTLSFGVVCWELFSEQAPFKGIPVHNLIPRILDDKLRLDIDSQWGSEMERLINLCWKEEPSQRISMQEAHHILKDFLNEKTKRENPL